MFAARSALGFALAPAQGLQQVRTMATLKEIRLRLKSVKSIQKITKSMKMVSAAKYARAERNLKAGKANGASSIALANHTDAASDSGDKPLIVAVSSDRGLCGGIHSGIAKYIKKLPEFTSGSAKVVIVGDKVRAMLARSWPQQILVSANAYGRTAPVFAEASFVGQEILASGYEFTNGSIVFNKFKSAVSYVPEARAILSHVTLDGKEQLNAYEEVDSDVLKNYSEFTLAANLYYAMLESAASEQSARMSAMENATKNAGEMIKSLQQQFNRTRQAVITTELIEIISGASAME